MTKLMSSAVGLSMELFGRPDFTRLQHQEGWCVFLNEEFIPECEIPDSHMRHFHGATLWQAQLILEQGFKAGLYHRGTQSSPCGVWGCSCRGDCLDRVHLVRGWSRHAQEVGVSGWDVPVVICIIVPRRELYRHLTLKNGTIINCWTQTPDTVIDIATRYCEIHIFADQFKRFRSLNEKWQQLVHGDLVLCRTVRGNPAFLFCDDLGAMTCGRVISTESREFDSWKRAGKTHIYRCPMCDELYSQCWPLSGAEPTPTQSTAFGQRDRHGYLVPPQPTRLPPT